MEQEKIINEIMRDLNCLPSYAKMVYNLRYRKIHEDEVVLTKEEYERLASYISEGRAREIFHEETEKLKEKIRKETAKDIYENFVKGYFRWDEEEFEDSFKEFIVKEYGVEVEE